MTAWRASAAACLTLALACHGTGRVDAAVLERRGADHLLHVTILGDPTDARVAPVREALAHWNSELRRTGRNVQLDSGTVHGRHVPDAMLRAASREVRLGIGPATWRLRRKLRNVPGDVIIALSRTDLISFGTMWRPDVPGIVAIRRADIMPLSQPNTVRNVVAHEVGHVLGLSHGADAGTLMCGRPAPCRPSSFVSERARFFPLTPADDARLRKRWP